MENQEEDEWPEGNALGKKFSLLEEQLRCPICDEFYGNPHMLNCGHTYCSICIRKHCDPLVNKTTSGTCPICKEKAEVFDLKPNTVLASVVAQFIMVRPDALRLITNGTLLVNTNEDVQIIEGDKRAASGVVINKRIPLLSFHGQKKDKVKEMLLKVCALSKVKLRCDGDKEVMEKRLREFVHLHNAQIGSLSPLSLEQVIRKVTEDETTLEKEAYKTARNSQKLERIKNGQVSNVHASILLVVTRLLPCYRL
jgi:hypothetical protein